MADRCWGFHASEIPADTTEVVTLTGDHYERHHGGWIHAAMIDGIKEYGRWMTESALLATGPVRCPVVEQVMAHYLAGTS